MSPGGSIKDRAALYLVKEAEEKGQIRPGGTVVEGTAGNTGIGLAHVCRSKGYKCVIYMPDTQSQEKIDLLRMLGADVRPVPGTSPLALSIRNNSPVTFIRTLTLRSGRIRQPPELQPPSQTIRRIPRQRSMDQPIRQCGQQRRPYRYYRS